jgi:hypothetical protein
MQSARIAGDNGDQPHPAGKETDMPSIRDIMAGANPTHHVKGFSLRTPTMSRFTNEETLLSAVKRQAGATELLDSDFLSGIDTDGRIGGSDIFLSKAAFGDLCHFTHVPVSFIKKLAEEDDTLALDVISSRIATTFHQAGRKLVLNTEERRVEGIVSADVYSPLRNVEMVHYILGSSPDLVVSGGWLEGQNMRVTAVDNRHRVEVQKGDIVRFGVEGSNAIGGDGSAIIVEYNERLVCTNGMRRAERGAIQRIMHRGDVQALTQKAVIGAVARATSLLPKLQASAKKYLNAADVHQMRRFVTDPKNGGGPTIAKRMVEGAVKTAQQFGRDDEHVVAWDMVNGITEAAHETKSIQRRAEVEGLAYLTLQRFGVAVGVA